jgi:hypothetical protein
MSAEWPNREVVCESTGGCGTCGVGARTDLVKSALNERESHTNLCDDLKRCVFHFLHSTTALAVAHEQQAK